MVDPQENSAEGRRQDQPEIKEEINEHQKETRKLEITFNEN